MFIVNFIQGLDRIVDYFYFFDCPASAPGQGAAAFLIVTKLP